MVTSSDDTMELETLGDLAKGHDGNDLETRKFLMPYPTAQPWALNCARRFLHSQLDRRSGLSQVEVSANIRSWLWQRRTHRHFLAFLSTTLAVLCDFV